MDYEPTLDDIYSSEITRLREQNRVLTSALSKVCLELECSNNPTFIQMAFWLRDKLKAALTATSQPTAAEVHQRMFDHGDATSQEGQHERR